MDVGSAEHGKILWCHGCWLSWVHQNIMMPWMLAQLSTLKYYESHRCWLSWTCQNIITPWMLAQLSTPTIRMPWMLACHIIYCHHGYRPSWARQNIMMSCTVCYYIQNLWIFFWVTCLVQWNKILIPHHTYTYGNDYNASTLWTKPVTALLVGPGSSNG